MRFLRLLLILIAPLLHASPAAAATCEEATQNLGDEPVRYFSAEGRALATACAVPPPSIDVRPLAEIEPPRDIPAAGWTSPLCVAWNDSATQCTRKPGTKTPECKPLDKDTHPASHVVCTDIDIDAVQRFCATMSLTQTNHYTNGTHDDFFDINGHPLWTYSLKEKAWDGSLDNDQRIAPAYKGPARTLASKEKNAVCLHAFEGNEEDFVFIGR